MSVPNPSCNPDAIARFLADRLSAAETAAFEAHLDECSACQAELECSAADESWWSAARVCLSPAGERAVGRAASAEGARLDQGTEAWPQSAPPLGDGPSLLAAIRPFLNPTDDPRMLGRIGNYEIAGVVGSGGNGVVLKGFDAALSRYVAIKLLSPRLADSGAARRRFSREAQAAAAVVHDNVMAIHAVAETHGLPYLVMPYVPGPSLEKRLRTSGPLGLEEVLRVGRQVAAGLAAAHVQGLVHRDIKPANILLEEGVERVRITDFGLARAIDDASLTRSGVIAGTPQYMSPEQARGEPIDHRADLFSLGCVLYAACTGRTPFRAETSYGVLRKICESEPRDLRELNPAIPLWLARLIERLLAKTPGERFDSAADVASLLEQCLAHVQQPGTIALPDVLFERDHRPRCYSATLAVATILLLVGGGIAARSWQAGARQEEIPRRALGVSPLVQRAAGASPLVQSDSPTAPAPQNAGFLAWADPIDQSIARLSADVDRLRDQSAGDLLRDDVWNDSLSWQIEKLKNDANELRGSVSEPHPSTPRQENQP